MPARTAFHPGSHRSRRGGPAHAQRGGPEARGTTPEAAEPSVEVVDLPTDEVGAPADDEQFRVASRDRLIPRQRDDEQLPPRISFEVLLALAIVVVCMVGAMAVGAAFTLQV